MDGPRPGKSRERVLSKFEIKAILTYARTRDEAYATVLELLLLTGQRSCEMGALRGEWIDFEKRFITFPSEFTKNKRTHVLPLGPRAFEILSRQRRTGLLFTTRGGIRPCVEWGHFKRQIDAQCQIPHWRIHDLRRTFATNLAELGIPVPVTEKLLNHVSGSRSGIVGVYQRYTYEKEARAAIERWEAHIQELMADPEAPKRSLAAE
jgi:integrase